MNTLINSHIAHFRDLLSGDPWLDESLEKKLLPVNEDNAFIRPIPDLHSVAELVSHMSEWKFSVLSILRGGERTIFMNSPYNWRSNEDLRKDGWNQLKKRFFELQEDLISFLESCDDAYLMSRDVADTGTYDYYVHGIIDHDIYHLGQLGLTIKFLKDRG